MPRNGWQRVQSITVKGQPTRAPFMAGLALGVGGYALLRVLLF